MTLTARWYQREAIDAIYGYWLCSGGNPVVALPTGGGKTLVIAILCQELLTLYPDMRIVVATHIKELIEQDYTEMLQVWPDAPVGIYSAGLNRRDAKAKILFCGIASAYKKINEIGAIDLVIVDECHLVGHDSDTMYRQFIDAARAITPDMRVLGLTATPWRLDSGRITEGKNKIFDELVYDTDIRRLIDEKFLCNVIAKKTAMQLNTDGVGKRGGDYITSELEVRVDKAHIVKAAVDEMLIFGKDRKSWLVFCVTVAHGEHVRDEIKSRGIACEAVFGHTPKHDRAEHIRAFKSGDLRALVSVGVLGTGFNAPAADMLCLLRPTASAGLYIQQVGRGMRNAPGKSNVLVLDFSGNVLRHGPIDDVSPKAEGRKSPRICPQCATINKPAALACVDCGYVWPVVPQPPRERKLNKPKADEHGDILKQKDKEPQWFEVKRVDYHRHTKWGAGPDHPPTLRVEYCCGFVFYSEYICLSHRGFAREKAVGWWLRRDPHRMVPKDVDEGLKTARELRVPRRIRVVRDGEWDRIVGWDFDTTGQVPAHLPAVGSPAPQIARPYDDDDDDDNDDDDDDNDDDDRPWF
jgi:DNA repair protein RadD